jgi:hypothetical protein
MHLSPSTPLPDLAQDSPASHLRAASQKRPVLSSSAGNFRLEGEPRHTSRTRRKSLRNHQIRLCPQLPQLLIAIPLPHRPHRRPLSHLFQPGLLKPRPELGRLQSIRPARLAHRPHARPHSVILRIFRRRRRTHALAVAELDPPAGLEGLDVLRDDGALCSPRACGDKDHAEVDEVEGLLPSWGNGVLDVLSQEADVACGSGREVGGVDVCAKEGVVALGWCGESGLDVQHPEAVCGADVEDGARGGGEVEGSEDEGAGVGLFEAVVECGQTA